MRRPTGYDMDCPAVSPDDFTGTDSERIQAALDAARHAPGRTVLLERSYVIDRAILLPSNVTLVNNGHVKLATGTHDNLVRNLHATGATTDVNLRISGHGIFEGSDEDWGSDQPAGVDGQSWRAIGILFANVERFEIHGVTIRDSHMWGMCFEQCRHGVISGITFDQTGKHPNQDGIDIRRGSHDIVVTDIAGATHDDMIALTNLKIRGDINILGDAICEPGRTDLDIHTITITNVVRRISNIFGGIVPTHFGGGILLLCEDGLRIHDVTIDGVTNHQQIHLGFTTINYAVSAQATVDDMYNISIANTGPAPIYLNRPLRNGSFVHVARMDIDRVYPAVVPKAGSLNITRQYHDGEREFFASVPADRS